MSDKPQTDPEAFEDPLSDYEPAEYPSELHRVLAEEPISAIQTQPFVHVTAATPIREAIELLEETKVSSLLVVDNEKLAGIFTERDVLENVAEQLQDVSSHPVSEVMTADPLIIYESDPVGTAVDAIAVAGHRHVPVLKMDGTVMGIVSPRRVLNYLQTQLG